MSNIGLNCDVCGRIVQGCTFVNGMKFCAKCYQETFGNNYSQTDIINAQYTEHLLKENAQLKEQQIRKQVCEKIKNLIDICFDTIETTNENGTKYSKEFSFKKFNAIINAIEKGE